VKFYALLFITFLSLPNTLIAGQQYPHDQNMMEEAGATLVEYIDDGHCCKVSVMRRRQRVSCHRYFTGNTPQESFQAALAHLVQSHPEAFNSAVRNVAYRLIPATRPGSTSSDPAAESNHGRRVRQRRS